MFTTKIAFCSFMLEIGTLWGTRLFVENNDNSLYILTNVFPRLLEPKSLPHQGSFCFGCPMVSTIFRPTSGNTLMDTS